MSSHIISTASERWRRLLPLLLLLLLLSTIMLLLEIRTTLWNGELVALVGHALSSLFPAADLRGPTTRSAAAAAGHCCWSWRLGWKISNWSVQIRNAAAATAAAAVDRSTEQLLLLLLLLLLLCCSNEDGPAAATRHCWCWCS